MLQNSRVTALTVFELLRETRLGGGKIPPPPPPRLGLNGVHSIPDTKLPCFDTVRQYAGSSLDINVLNTFLRCTLNSYLQFMVLIKLISRKFNDFL